MSRVRLSDEIIFRQFGNLSKNCFMTLCDSEIIFRQFGFG